MSEPTSIDFRVSETQGILDDLAAVRRRITDHQAYLTDPVLSPTHKLDVRDTDVVLANLALAAESLTDAERQTDIALRLTKLALPAPAPAEPPPSAP